VGESMMDPAVELLAPLFTVDGHLQHEVEGVNNFRFKRLVLFDWVVSLPWRYVWMLSISAYVGVVSAFAVLYNIWGSLCGGWLNKRGTTTVVSYYFSIVSLAANGGYLSEPPEMVDSGNACFVGRTVLVGACSFTNILFVAVVAALVVSKVSNRERWSRRVLFSEYCTLQEVEVVHAAPAGDEEEEDAATSEEEHDGDVGSSSEQGSNTAIPKEGTGEDDEEATEEDEEGPVWLLSLRLADLHRHSLSKGTLRLYCVSVEPPTSERLDRASTLTTATNSTGLRRSSSSRNNSNTIPSSQQPPSSPSHQTAAAGTTASASSSFGLSREELQSYSKDELLECVQFLQSELATARAAAKRLQHDQSQHSASSSQRSSTNYTSPLVSTFASSSGGVVAAATTPARRYEISTSVMVIDNGTVAVYPLYAVLKSKEKRNRDALEELMLRQPREADTPVVASRFLGGGNTSLSIDRFSIGSLGRTSLGKEDMPQVGSDSHLTLPSGAAGGWYSASDDSLYSPTTTSSSAKTRRRAVQQHQQQHPDDEAGSGGRRGAGGGEVNNPLYDEDGEDIVRESSTGQNHRTSWEDADEPTPKRPTLYYDPCSVNDAMQLSRRAGLPHVLCDSGFGHLSLPRDISIDSEALVSGGTLRTFFQRFRGSAGGALGVGGGTSSIRRDLALTPASSFAVGIYHYIVKTFAVTNSCTHHPDDVEGFARTLITLCGDVERVLKAEPKHGVMTSPCYVFGDLHGNFEDLFYFLDNLISFQDLRYTPHKFLFLGDYVDRGEFSVEVVAYLFSMKVLAPDKVLLLRGNHEDTLVSGDVGGYGSTSFRSQCNSIFGPAMGSEVWSRISQTFAYLPLSASIDGVIFCTHGGIPRYSGGPDQRMKDLTSDRFPPMTSFFEVPDRETTEHARLRQVGMDTCWADPAEDEDMLDEYGFGDNPRGKGVILFGSKAVDTFLDHFGFQYIFRAHQEKADGLKLSKNARVFTIFSTSSYVGHRNGAGVVLVSDRKIRLMMKNADNNEELSEDNNEEGEPYGVGNSSPARRR